MEGEEGEAKIIDYEQRGAVCDKLSLKWDCINHGQSRSGYEVCEQRQLY